MLGQHYSSQCQLSSPSFGIVCSHLSGWLTSLHSLAQPSEPLPKPMHLPSPPPPLTTVSPCTQALAHVPSTTILFSFPLASQFPFLVLLSSSQSQFFFSSSDSKVSSEGFSPNLLGMPTPLWIHTVLFLVFPSTGKVVVWSSYYPPGEQDLKCVALEGMEMPTLV